MPGVLHTQVAQRFVAARLEATNAKAARDKDRQRTAGAAIRDLKKVLQAHLTCHDRHGMV